MAQTPSVTPLKSAKCSSSTSKNSLTEESGEGEGERSLSLRTGKPRRDKLSDKLSAIFVIISRDNTHPHSPSAAQLKTWA